MSGPRTAGMTATAIGLALAGAGCGSDGADASHLVAPTVVGVNFARSASTGSPAITDAISRILPSINPASADELRGPLTSINNQLASRNSTALLAAIRVAREELQVALAVPEDGPDLDAIALAIDSVDPAAR